MLRRNLLVISALLIFSSLLCSPAHAGDAVKIGVVIESTGTGASQGGYWVKGVDTAVNEINKSGGILGNPIKYKVFDTQSKAPISVSAVKKAISWGACGISGPIWSSSTLANMHLSQENKIPQCVGSENYKVTTKGSPYIYRTSTQQGFEIPKLLNWIMSEKKPKAMAVFYINNDLGIGGKEVAEKYLKEKWNTDVALLIAAQENQTNYAAEVKQLKKKKVDAVFVNSTPTEAAMFFREVRKMNLDLLLVSNNTGISEDTTRLAKEACDGVYGMSGFEYSVPDKNCKRLSNYYKEKWGEWPDNEFMKGYNSIYLIKLGYERAGGMERDKLPQVMHNVFITPQMNPNLAGGNLYYDKSGDLHAWDYLVRVEWNGKDTEQKIVAALPPLKGPDSTKKTVYY
jgi:branched-chain amino acid transport system substrate-binding protein